MILLFWFLAAALATWRLASLIARERGPLGLFTYPRRCVGIEHEPDGTPSRDPQGGELLLRAVTPWTRVDAALFEIAHGMTCVWCNSLWIALLITAPLAGSICPVLTFTLQTSALTVLALSTAAILIDRLVS